MLFKTFVAVATGLIVYAWDGSHGAEAQTPASTNNTRWGMCEREAEKLLGQKPVRIGGSIRQPKKSREMKPNYPKLPPGTTASGMWIGEALVNPEGKVTQVWPIREVILKPIFPAFNSAMADAIRSWEFEPVLLDRKPTPFCMTVSVNIDF